MHQDTYVHLFSHLESLSALKLHALASELVLQEKVASAALIAHLAEISRKKAHLELGYKNLFDYCIRGLGLSEGSANLKIQVANKARELPLVLEYLSENRISLSVAGLLAPILDTANVEMHLKACERMTKRQAEVYLSAFRPKDPWESGIRRQPTREPVAASAAGCGESDGQVGCPMGPTAAGSPSAQTEGELFSLDGSLNAKPAAKLEPATPDIFNFRFSGSKAFKEKLERYAEVLGIKSPEKNLFEIFEQAIEAALEKKDPRRKLARKLQREAKRKGKAKQDEKKAVPKSPVAPSPVPSRPDEVADFSNHSDLHPAPVKTQALASQLPASQARRSRYIPKPSRDLVLERAGYQCEYRSSGGLRCSERSGLTIDHIQPFARCGGHELDNLRVLCRSHNFWKAERDFGREFVRRKMAARR